MSPTCFNLCKINGIVDNAIKRCHSLKEWKYENRITHEWLSALKSNHSKFSFHSPHMQVAWDAYKMTGKLETAHGDIAVVVKLTFPNKKELKGVGFLEAKKLYIIRKQYGALKKPQLTNMVNNSAHHHLLLYDFEPQEVLSLCGSCDSFCFPHSRQKVHSIVIPTPHLLAFATNGTVFKKGRDLSSIGYALSEQIFLRYFRGLDLNFDEQMVNDVISGNRDKTLFIIVAHVVMGENDVEVDLNDITPQSGNFIKIDTTQN